tara:strand:- start:163 stop:369 length:207 start_codon:yes stop_codon:yes gene_type:complete
MFMSKQQMKLIEKQNQKISKIIDQNPENLKKMVIVSENMQQKTSKLILNHNAIRFKENIAAEITKNQK